MFIVHIRLVLLTNMLITLITKIGSNWCQLTLNKIMEAISFSLLLMNFYYNYTFSISMMLCYFFSMMLLFRIILCTFFAIKIYTITHYNFVPLSHHIIYLLENVIKLLPGSTLWWRYNYDVILYSCLTIMYNLSVIDSCLLSYIPMMHSELQGGTFSR